MGVHPMETELLYLVIGAVAGIAGSALITAISTRVSYQSHLRWLHKEDEA